MIIHGSILIMLFLVALARYLRIHFSLRPIDFYEFQEKLDFIFKVDRIFRNGSASVADIAQFHVQWTYFSVDAILRYESIGQNTEPVFERYWVSSQQLQSVA